MPTYLPATIADLPYADPYATPRLNIGPSFYGNTPLTSAAGTGWESAGTGPLTTAVRPAPLALNPGIPVEVGGLPGASSAATSSPGWFARNLPTLSNLSAPTLANGWRSIPGMVRGAVPTVGKGLGTGAAFNYGGKFIGENVFGDNTSNNSDPTSFGQLYTRGLSGGGKIGGWLGPAGAFTGAIGAGIGNAIGGTVMGALGQDSSLGNVPLIGPSFGGGTATRARAIEEATGQDLSKLTWEGGKERLDRYKLAPEVRAQFVTDFNRDVDILRARGMDVPEAMATTAQAYFDGKPKAGDTPAVAPLINNYLDQSKKAAAAGPAAEASQADMYKNAMALQAMMMANAPDIFNERPVNLDQFRAIRDDALSHLSGDMRGFAAQAGADIEGRVAQTALNQARIFQNIPVQIMAAAQAAEQAKAQQIALELEKARISAGKNSANLPAE